MTSTPATNPRSEASGTTGARRGRPGYDTATVLSICVDMFTKHGYDATSMGMLAERLGISKSAIYHHVPSKLDILRQALDAALDPLEEAFRYHIAKCSWNAAPTSCCCCGCVATRRSKSRRCSADANSTGSPRASSNKRSKKAASAATSTPAT